MGRIKLFAKLAVLALGVLFYVWFAAVRRAGEVKKRKALRRLDRRASSH